MFSKKFIERFWSRVKKSPRCWEWQGSRAAFGYGRVGIGDGSRGSVTTAHRVAWMLTHGTIPKGMQICHSCDNPPCVRPDHLFLGTPRDNVHDMISKGRRVQPERTRGEDHHNAVLTDAQVLEARKRVAHGESVAAVAFAFDVMEDTMRRAVVGKNFRHLPGAVRPTGNPGQFQTKRITAFGETLSADEWSKRFGVRAACIRLRLRRGWTPERAVKP